MQTYKLFITLFRALIMIQTIPYQGSTKSAIESPNHAL